MAKKGATGTRPLALETWTRLTAAAAAARAHVNRRLVAAADISLAENLVLCRVAMAPGSSVRMAELADMLGVAKSAITKTVDRLESSGWVVRKADPSDRRAVRATLTADGEKLFRRSQPLFAAAASDYLTARLNESELETLAELLAKLIAPEPPRR